MLSYAGYIAYQNNVFDRLLELIMMLFKGVSIEEAEQHFGSARIGAVINSFSHLIHVNYSTNFSLIGYLNVFLMSPIFPFTIFFVINRFFRGGRLKFMCGFLLASLSGPILVWPLYWLLFKNLKNEGRSNV